eukprot:11547589-Karenia_brevis.AAC.1
MKSMRDTMKSSLQSEAPPCQFGGGCRNGSTAVANLMARAQVDIGFACGLSVIQLFIDVQTAFAAMIRALAIPCDASDAVFLERL